MTPQQHDAAAAVFLELMDLPPEEALSRLPRASGGDPLVEVKVRRMLRAHHDADNPLDTPPSLILMDLAGAVPPVLKPEELPGKMIGPFRVIREIASGGQGTVYEAEQDSPRRRVALKVISLPASAESAGWMLRRFERESEILARLNHPSIAQIYASGIAESPRGRRMPYMAMELVAGVPITEHTRDTQLSREGRLALLAEVCRAVHAAHQRGVVHRDLKPSNILIEPDGRPKIIDFGISAVEEAETATTRMTHAGWVLGTLRYMSPEQAAGKADEIDTRTDVYAMGVVAFELLTGRPPYELTRAALLEAVRVICEDVPPPLSAIDRSLRGDVEVIIGKALRKDREHRYQSAQELADEITRHLRGEPINARAPTTAYYLRSIARRYPRTTSASAAAVLALVGVSIIAWVQAARAIAAETTARANLAKSHSDLADLAAIRGEWELSLAEVASAFDTGQGDPFELRFKRVRALDALGRAAEADRELTTLESLADPSRAPGDERIARAAARVKLWRGDIGLRTARERADWDRVESLLQAAIGGPISPADRAFAEALLTEDLEKADALSRRARESDPHDPRYLELATVHAFLLGRYADAAELARVAQAKIPSRRDFRTVEAMSLSLASPAGVAAARERIANIETPPEVQKLIDLAELLHQPIPVEQRGAFEEQYAKEIIEFGLAIMAAFMPSETDAPRVRGFHHASRWEMGLRYATLAIAIRAIVVPDTEVKRVRTGLGNDAASLLELMNTTVTMTDARFVDSPRLLRGAQAGLARSAQSIRFARYRQPIYELLSMTRARLAYQHGDIDASRSLAGTLQELAALPDWVPHTTYGPMMVRAAMRISAYDIGRELSSRYERAYPESPAIWSNRAELEYAAGNYAGAVVAAAKAIKLRPEDTQAESLLRRAAERAGAIGQADESVPVADYLAGEGLASVLERGGLAPPP